MTYHYKHSSSSISITAITAVTLTAITTIGTTYLVSKYGLSGALRYIWEGDHLPPHIREAIDILDDVEIRLKKQKKKLDKVEMVVEVARLNSVDSVDDSNADDTNDADNEHAKTKQNVQVLSNVSPLLSKDLSMLSYTLDKLASEIDSVQSSGDVDVKRRKKEMSGVLVSMMERIDGFLKECGIET